MMSIEISGVVWLNQVEANSVLRIGELRRWSSIGRTGCLIDKSGVSEEQCRSCSDYWCCRVYGMSDV